MQDIEILVALHKPYSLPTETIYVPILVGNTKIPGMENALRDNTGQNISKKNPYYCEMTALYWAWKNLDTRYLGIVHYRRYFAGKHFALHKEQRIATRTEIEAALAKAPVIVPRKRNYWIETTYSQYAHAHHGKDLDSVRQILSVQYPEYLESFDLVMGRTKGHRFNMVIMRRDLLDSYCTWLFDLLFQMESRIDIQSYDSYNQRVYGFLAERLLDVWIEANHVPYTEMPVVFLEKQHWLKKGTAFLRRKIKGELLTAGLNQ